MELILNDVETRVLGVLMEKSMTTPDYYPMSLNALTNGCNQKSNRQPVVSFDEVTVARAIDSLKEKRLVVGSDSGRVVKYSEIFTTTRNLMPREAAILTVLMLRGPQTGGELRGRTERMYSYEGLAEVEQVLNELGEDSMSCKMPRQPGRKECRYSHLLSGEPDIEAESGPQPAQEPAMRVVQAENERITALEEEVGLLRQELDELKTEFSRFKQEFE